MTIRVIHLGGGCRAIESKESLQLQPRTLSGKVAAFSLQNPGAAYSIVRSAGLKVIGADVYSRVEQLDGRELPEWQSHKVIEESNPPSATRAGTWSLVAHAAVQSRNGQLWDITRRIGHQLQTCEWRLREISESYSHLLLATVGSKSFVVGNRVQDRFTWLAYLAIQSFLVDACVLRDYLAEYRALLLHQSGEWDFASKVTEMVSLREHYLEETTSIQKIDKLLQEQTDSGGWLHRLGGYRDMVVHCAPLENAGKSVYALCYLQRLDAQTQIPSVKLPIPADPEKILTDCALREYSADPRVGHARFLDALEEPHRTLDGLDYADCCVEQLGNLANGLIELSRGTLPTLFGTICVS